MSQILQTSLFSTNIPGAYAAYSVSNQPTSVANSGVIAIIGEASQGPDYTLESDLDTNAFDPTQLNAVIAKYGSNSRITNAFRQAIGPSLDPSITGSFNLIKIVKTNKSTPGYVSILNLAGGTYGTLVTTIYGAIANNYSTTLTDAVVETVAGFTGTFVTPNTAFGLNIRVNGGAATPITVPVTETPTQFVTLLQGIPGLSVTGGVGSVVNSGTILLTVGTATGTGRGASVTFTSGTTWTSQPTVGSTLLVTGGAFSHAQANEGSYTVTASTGTTITATKLADWQGTSGTVTTPIAETVAAFVTGGLNWYTPVVLAVTGTGDGFGKSLEITQTSGSPLETLFYVTGTATPLNVISETASFNGYISGTTLTVTLLNSGVITVGSTISAASSTGLITGTTVTALGSGTGGTGTYTVSTSQTVGTSSAPVVITTTLNNLSVSAAERSIAFAVIPPVVSGSSTYTFTTGGQIGLQVGYMGTTATLTIGPTAFYTTVTGGSGASIASTPLSNFATIAQMAAYIQSFTGYTATAFNPVIGLQSPITLDEGTYGICSNVSGILAGRVKYDAYAFYTALNLSGTVTLGTYNSTTNVITPAPASAGLPADYVPSGVAKFFANGTLGGTTEASFQSAIDACQGITTNFIVPLISQNASLDIAAGLTDPSSTYLIDSVNSYVTKHCQFMFGPPQMGNRQGFLSRRDTLVNNKNAAANLNNFLVSMAFQDVSIVESNGIVQEQPWANAMTAAAVQAAGFYQSIFFKSLDISNAIQAAGDFNPKNRGQLSSVLSSGLLPIQPVNGFRYVSDQTTYGTDSNPIFNSIQAVYAANLCALTLAQRMETAYVGKSLADVNASVALASIDMICKSLFDSKLIAASDGAPKGYNGATINISGPIMTVNLNVFIASCLYFVNITFNIEQINSTATS